MSERACTYVAELSRDRVTAAQKHVLSAIAQHHTERYGTANLSLEDLAADVLRSKRQLGRIFKKLTHLLEYTPGVGSGNYSKFRFLELEKATQRRHKGDILDTAIRKENLNQIQNQNLRILEPTISGEFSPTSSSPNPDDVERVISAFEQSPVTSEKANASDRAIAKEFLLICGVERAEYVILLATARRLISQIPGKVHSMAYFKEAALDPDGCGDYSESYVDYLRHVIQRETRKSPQKVSVA